MGKTSQRLLEYAFFGGIAALYLLTLCPTVYWYDSGEFITAAALLGSAHPPGFPLYCLLGRLASLLPIGETAWRINLLSAAAAWGTLLMLYLISRGDAARPSGTRSLVAFLPPALLGLSFDYWNVASFAEVYTLDLFLWSCLLYAGRQVRGRRGFLISCFLLGLLLAARSTNAIFLVAIVPYLWQRFPAAGKERLLGLVALSASLSLLLYLPLTGSIAGRPVQGNPGSWPGLVAILSAAGYTSYLSLSVGEILTRAGQLASHAWQALTPLGLLLAAIGLNGMRGHAASKLPFALFCLDILVKILFASQVVQGHFYLTSFLFLSVYIPGGADRALSFRLIRNSRKFAVVMLSACLLVGLANYRLVDKADYRRAYTYGRIVLSLAEERGARLLCGGDNEYQTASYLRHIVGLRPDVELSHLSLLPERQLIEWLAQRVERPLYLTFYDKAIAAKYGLQPWGPLWKVSRGQRLGRTAGARRPLAEFAGEVTLYDMRVASWGEELPVLRLELEWQLASTGEQAARTAWFAFTDRQGNLVSLSDGDPAQVALSLPADSGNRGSFRQEYLLVLPPGLAQSNYSLALAITGTGQVYQRGNAAEGSLGNYYRDNPRTKAGLGYGGNLVAEATAGVPLLQVVSPSGRPVKGRFVMLAELLTPATW